MNDRLRLKVAIMAICFVSLISKGIVLERLTHKNDLLDVYPSFNIQNVDIKKTELEESLKMIMDKAALSKYFKNFSIQFVKTNYCKEPIIIVIDLRSVFENKEKPIGLYCSDHQQYFFIKEDSNRLWEKYFSYSGSEDSVELRQIIVPDSVYIMEPDVSFVCVAKIEGNLCKILYCEIDGEIDGKIDGKIDEAATTTEGNQPYKYSTKELDRENGLDWYDSKARMYDPTIGRTPTQDPMAEKYYSLSPYAWCAGNPLKYIDLDGRDILFAEGSSPQFIRDYNLARNILKEKGVGDFITNIENDRSVILYIAESDESKFSSQTMTLLWNPTMGIITNNNVKLSPTTVLNHEFDHAVNYIRNPKQHIEDTKYIDYQYDNMEERRVITGSEQKTATALGEITNGQVTREDHYATGYTTIGPTTTTQDANLPIGKVLEEVTIIGKK